MKGFFYTIMFVFFASVSVQATELSLDDAINYALKNNEDVQIADYSISQMNELIREIQSMSYPTFNIGASYQGTLGQQYPSNKSLTTPEYTVGGFNLGVSADASLLIYAFGLVQKSIDSAKLSKELSIKQKDKSLAALRYSVQTAYYAALTYDENYKIALESYQNALNTKKKFDKSASVRSSQSDLLKIQADIASRKPEVESTLLLRKQGYRLLQILCVLPEPVTVLTTTFGKIPRPDLNEQILLDMVKDAFDVKLLETQVMLNYKTAETKEAATNPTISLFGQYSFSDQSPHVWLSSPLWTGEGALGISINIPLYDGGKAAAQGRQERFAAYSNTSKLTQTKRYLARNVTDALEKYISYQSILKLDDEAIKLAEQSYQMSLARFLNGQTSAVELNDVERSLSQLKTKRVSTVNTIFSSLAEIEQILGQVK